MLVDNLAKDLADQAAQENDAQVAARMEELALEQELKAFEAKAKFSPTVCERTEGDYEAYMLGIKTSYNPYIQGFQRYSY